MASAHRVFVTSAAAHCRCSKCARTDASYPVRLVHL